MSTPSSPDLRRVTWYLYRSGFAVLDRNWHHDSRMDCILAADRHCLVICAVTVQPRTRSEFSPQTMPAAVNTRLRAKAARWMTAHGHRFEKVRIDLVSVVREGAGGFSISHVQEAG